MLQITIRIILTFQVPHTPTGEKWYFCPYCAPGRRWNHYEKKNDFFGHAHIFPPKKIKTDETGDVPMDTTEAPPKLVVTYSEATAIFKSGQDLTFDELADKVLLQTNLPIIKCPPSDPEKRDEYVRAKTILVQRLKNLKRKSKYP